MVDYGLEGRVVLVTGAARKKGLGRAIALRMAELGAHVVLTGHSPNSYVPLIETAKQIEALGRRALPLRVDTTEASQVEEMVGSALKSFGRIDILINNAGVDQQRKPLQEIPASEWDHIFAVNCKGTFLCCKHVVPQMIARGEGGKILNVASRLGKVGQPFRIAYAASKAAIINLTHSLALELAPYGINVNAICPGLMPTDMGEAILGDHVRLAAETQTPEEVHKRLLASFPMGRLPEVEEVANVAAFLVSPHADYLTGQAVNFTGGQLFH